LLQVTGKDNYRAVGKVLGLDLLKYPDLLAQPDIALKASIAWWESKIPDAIMGDIVKVTKRVNGGSIGMADRIALTNEAREVLG
jgi:putative chitinase